MLHNSRNKKIFLITVSFLAISFLVFLNWKYKFLILKGNGADSYTIRIIPRVHDREERIESSDIYACTRTTRLDNLPQYDRALSLIKQRIDEYEEGWDESFHFTFFPTNIVNCIKVIEFDPAVDSDLEGYFEYDYESVKEDYFPIYVSSDYQSADDIVTALLLTHEITHVQQSLDVKHGLRSNDCVQDEVDAFVSQLEFYIRLSTEENSSVVSRVNDNKDYLHNQLKMLRVMFEINRNDDCNYGDFDQMNKCMNDNLEEKLTQLILEDENYIKQCGLE